MATSVSIIISASAARALSVFRAVRSAIGSLVRQAGTVGRAAAPFALMAGKIVAVGAAALAATGVIANLLGAIQLVAPAAAAGGLALLGVKLALNGMEDALKAGLDGDVEKFEKALGKLAPQAADVVRTLVRLRDAWRPLAKDFQGRVFEGAAGELQSLSNFIKPIADKWLPRLAMKFAEVRNAIADGIARYAADGRLEAVWINVTDAVGNLLDIIPALGRAFGDVLEVASPAFNKLSEGIKGAAQQFSDWIRQAKESGKLKEWLDTAIVTLTQLKDIAKNVGTTIAGIFGATSENGASFLESLVKGSKDLSDWVNSSEGQSFIEFWSSLIGILAKVSPMLEYILGWLNVLSAAWGAAWSGMKDIFQGVINWILMGWEKVMRAAAAAADAMGMDSLAGKLRGAANAVAGFRNDVNNYLDGIRKTVDITVNYRARMIGNHLVSGSQQSGSYSSGIGGRASGGVGSGLKWVGEYGPELVDLGASGRVYNNRQSRNMFRHGEISEQLWRQLMSQGWKGDPTDGMEAIYAPSSPTTIQVEAAPGSATNAVAQLVLRAIRDRLVVLKVVGNKVVPA